MQNRAAQCDLHPLIGTDEASRKESKSFWTSRGIPIAIVFGSPELNMYDVSVAGKTGALINWNLWTFQQA